MAKEEIIEPKLTEMTVSYSVGVKANLGNYESADTHLSRTERWDVSGLTEDGASTFYNERYEALRRDLGRKAEREYRDMIGAPEEDAEEQT